MHFIILHWGNSFVLKPKKLNQGVDKNFLRYCKLMLWLSVLGAIFGSWLAGGQSEGNFARPSIVYTWWLSTRELEVCTSFSWPSEKIAIRKWMYYKSQKEALLVKTERHIEWIFILCLHFVFIEHFSFQHLRPVLKILISWKAVTFQLKSSECWLTRFITNPRPFTTVV